MVEDQNWECDYYGIFYIACCWYLGPVCSTRSVWLTPPLVWGCPAHVYTTEEDWGEDEETALLLTTRTTWW